MMSLVKPMIIVKPHVMRIYGSKPTQNNFIPVKKPKRVSKHKIKSHPPALILLNIIFALTVAFFYNLLKNDED